MSQSKSLLDLDCSCPNRVKSSGGLPQDISGLVNARALSLEFDSFDVPSSSEIRKLKTGDLVKVARNSERFWVVIDGYVGRKWFGTIVSVLKRNKDIKRGDCIFFQRKNIYDVRFRRKQNVR